MDNDKRNTAHTVNRNDCRSSHRNITDSNINTRADINIYPENFSRIPVHNIIVALDQPENASDDP